MRLFFGYLWLGFLLVCAIAGLFSPLIRYFFAS
jgi:hypothetical protein